MCLSSIPQSGCAIIKIRRKIVKNNANTIDMNRNINDIKMQKTYKPIIILQGVPEVANCVRFMVK